jgi:drug/metabolite transporter (DMT)-like permease
LSWIGIAIISAVILAFVNIIDSHILSQRINRFRTYLCILAPVYLVLGTLLYVSFPLPDNLTPWLVLGAIGNSILRATGITIMMYLLRTQSVSRVIPVVYAYPVLVAIMAVPILGESLTSLAWLAVLIVVGGVVLVGLGRGSAQGRFSAGILILLVITCVLFAGADISSKYLLGYFSFWKLFSINTLVMGAIFGTIGFRPANFHQAKNLERRNSLLILMITNEAVAIGAMLLGTQAMSLGPIAIVSAILGSRPIFVALLAMAVSYIAPSFLGAQARERKVITLVAAAMIVAGIALIYVG